MKLKIAQICLTVSLPLFAEGYWIQVLNNQTAVPDAFLEKVTRYDQPYKIIDSGEGQKVWIGAFESYEAAQSAMGLIRCRIASDAFIIADDTNAQPQVEEVPDHLVRIAGKMPVERPVQAAADTKLSAVSDTPVSLSEGTTSLPEASAAKQDSAITVAMDQNSTQTPEVKNAAGCGADTKRMPCICICDKKALRKVELDDALKFYKTSSDYRFEAAESAMPGFGK